MTFVDVGANIGWFSVLGARLVGEHGFVVVVEPGPNNLPILRANLWRHRAHNALVLPMAAYAHTGHVEMKLNRRGRRELDPARPRDAVLVPCARLRRAAGGAPGGRAQDRRRGQRRPGDPRAAGASRAARRSTIVSEWWTAAYGGHGSRPGDVLRFYESLGMRFWLLGDAGDEQPTTPHALLGLSGTVPFVNIVMRKAR